MAVARKLIQYPFWNGLRFLESTDVSIRLGNASTDFDGLKMNVHHWRHLIQVFQTEFIVPDNSTTMIKTILAHTSAHSLAVATNTYGVSAQAAAQRSRDEIRLGILLSVYHHLVRLHSYFYVSPSSCRPRGRHRIPMWRNDLRLFQSSSLICPSLQG